MSTASEGAGERRSGTRALIDKLLAERQQMLVLYERVAGVAPYDQRKPDAALVREFSEILVDYMAAGHFGLYQRIADGKERRQGVVELAQRLYPRISRTTEMAVAFNDAYEKSGKGELDGDLAEQLSGLGEQLALRIELEDQLIARLLARE